MKWEQFRNRFKRDARQQGVDVDMDAIWEALEPQVDELNKEEPRRRRFVFWILLAGILAIGASWLLVSNGDKQEVIVEKQIGKTNPTSSNQESESSENLNSVVELEKESDQSLDKNETGTDVSLKLNNTITNQSFSLEKDNAPSFSNEKNESDKERLGLEKDLANVNLNQSQNRTNQSQKNITTPTTPGLSLLKNKTSNSGKDLGSDVNMNLEQKEINSTRGEGVPPNKTTSNNINKDVLTLPSLQMFLPLEKGETITLGELLPIVSGDLITKKQDSKKTSLQGGNPDHKTEPSNLKFWTGVYGGASFINRSLSTKDGSGNVLLQNRNQYESPLEASHYGISIGVEYKDRFRFSSGIQQAVIAERLNFNETLTVVDSIIGVKVLRLNFVGDTIPIMGNIPRTTTTKNQLKVYNTYKLIDIPVTIGYHYTFKEKWNVGVQAGILVNISLKTKGGIYDKMLQEVNIETNQSNIFKSKIGLNYHLGVSIGRSFSDKIELNFSPTVRFFPNDFSVQNYGLSQKYFLVGGDLGLRYRF